MVPLRCPHLNCVSPLSDRDISSLLPGDSLFYYNKIVLFTSNLNETVRCCPMKSCRATVRLDRSSKIFPLILCPKCQYTFCSHCAEAPHPGESCLELIHRVCRDLRDADVKHQNSSMDLGARPSSKQQRISFLGLAAPGVGITSLISQFIDRPTQFVSPEVFPFVEIWSFLHFSLIRSIERQLGLWWVSEENSLLFSRRRGLSSGVS